MATPEDIPLFEYEPLPDASTYIRLLQVVDLREDQQPYPVHCRLTVWPRAAAPPYHAISYTWGDPDDTTTVFVNDRRMVVRRNCEYVLKQAKWYDGEARGRRLRRKRGHGQQQQQQQQQYQQQLRFFWCDAICINQKDTAEKSFQVAMMGAIYARAESVLACVGERGEGSELLFSELRRKAVIFLSAVAALESAQAAKARRTYNEVLARIGGVNLSSKAARRGMINSRLLKLCSFLWVRTRDKGNWPRLVAALGSLANREYFLRLWIYQELSLGADIILCCGDYTAPLRVVYGMLTVVYGATKSARRLGLSSFDLDQSWDGLRQCEDMIEVGYVSRLNKKRLLEAIYTVSLLKCFDVRDRIYGVLSLVEWGLHETPIFPDYDRDAFELGADVLRRLGAFHFRIVMKSLELGSCISEGLLKARRRRLQSTITFDHGANAAGVPTSAPHTAAFSHAFGLCILEEENDLLFGIPSTSRIGVNIQKWPDHCEEEGSLETHQEKIMLRILLPVVAKGGDWCIFHKLGAFNSGWVVLVARCVDEMGESLRESGCGQRFMITGKGVAFLEGWESHLNNLSRISTLEKEFTDSFGGSRRWFDVYCEAEDALCLEGSFAPDIGIDPGVLEHDRLSEYFETRVCGQPGSSFALSIYSRNKVQAW